MTIQTCKKYYEIAKKRGNKAEMEFWKKRAGEKGGKVGEEEEQEEEKKKAKK